MSIPQPTTLSIHTETLLNGLSFNMVKVDGGNFLLEDKIETSISTFYMGQYPVTQALWESVMGENPSKFIGHDRPVEYVSWEECQKFLSKLNQQLGLTGIREYRLPTEAEWEFAARGGVYKSDHIFAGSSRLEKAGWFRENSHSETQPGGLLAPNELGIFDMSGNIWEWCEDWFDENYYRECYKSGVVSNPKGPEKGHSRVLRGGSWSHDESLCRVADRFHNYPGYRDNVIGFRLSRTAL